jgi:DNA primase
MPEDVLAAGEGLETMLSLRQLAPRMPAVAALSAAHLAALALPATLRRLYLALDWDDAGRWAGDSLAAKARSIGAETVILATTHGDLNDALRKIGADELRALLRLQFAPVDVERFLRPTAG